MENFHLINEKARRLFSCRGCGQRRASGTNCKVSALLNTEAGGGVRGGEGGGGSPAGFPSRRVTFRYFVMLIMSKPDESSCPLGRSERTSRPLAATPRLEALVADVRRLARYVSFQRQVDFKNVEEFSSGV